MEGLQYLNLSECCIDDEDLELIAGLKNLRQLNISCCNELNGYFR